MAENRIDLRTYIFLDSLQFQMASFLATTSKGYYPVAQQACMVVEISPGIEIHRFTDIKKREIEFRVRMLTRGVHVMHGGGCLTMAHSDQDIEKIFNATREVEREMVKK